MSDKDKSLYIIQSISIGNGKRICVNNSTRLYTEAELKKEVKARLDYAASPETFGGLTYIPGAKKGTFEVRVRKVQVLSEEVFSL